MYSPDVTNGVLDQPFGPREAGTLVNEDGEIDLTLTDINATQYIELFSTRRASVVIGRKGAGKTSLLQLLKDPELICCEIDMSLEYRGVLAFLSEHSDNNTVDFASRIWRNVLWNRIIELSYWELINREILIATELKEIAKYVKSLESVISSSSTTKGSKLLDDVSGGQSKGVHTTVLAILASISRKELELERVEKSLLTILKDNELKVRVLIDTLEEYKILDNKTAEVCISGLLHCAKGLTFKNSCIDSVVFVSDELAKYSRRNLSRSVLKDFENSNFLKWTADELALLSAHKLRMVFSHFKHSTIPRLREKKSYIDFFREMLPVTVTDQRGNTVDTLTILLRHTQLSPRHLVVLLNEVFGGAFTLKEKYISASNVDEDRFWIGFNSAVRNIYDDIIANFSEFYPHSRDIIERTIPLLEIVTNDDELREVYDSAEFRKDFDLTYEGYKAILADTGVLGNLLDTAGSTNLAKFSYSEEAGIVLTSGKEFCVHPIFSHVLLPDSSDKRIVHPYGANLIKLS